MSYEHFAVDRFERPVDSSIRPRVNSGSCTVENDMSQNELAQLAADAARFGIKGPDAIETFI
jgi:hypothetical protein